ncbi:hypothetical protein [Frankia sp. AiPa1]|uniref:hypothetical protein n=1 Tax=Frankia sp. AiPa1 TaxID=573492 RepID=UPI00202B79FE|nr:hypothetical protein [Frankia sp. AiPa1]MCL9759013.1 hypothetical protein [Frankia sp. AiPa1]
MGLVVAAALVLTGCASGGSGSAAPSSESTATVAAASAFQAMRDSPAAGAFVTAFRPRFPSLAEDRTDSSIRNDVAHICLDDLPRGNQTALSHIPARFEHNGITPDPLTATAILALAQSTVCSSQ